MTLDLLGDKLMLFGSAEEPAWREKAAALNTRPPMIVETLEAPVAPALVILDPGVLLLRPDGQRSLYLATA